MQMIITLNESEEYLPYLKDTPHLNIEYEVCVGGIQWWKSTKFDMAKRIGDCHLSDVFVQ